MQGAVKPLSVVIDKGPLSTVHKSILVHEWVAMSMPLCDSPGCLSDRSPGYSIVAPSSVTEVNFAKGMIDLAEFLS